MMKHIVKVPSVGGRIAVKTLAKAVKLGLKHQLEHVWFSARQEVLFELPHATEAAEFTRALSLMHIAVGSSDTRNVVTSLPANDIFPKRSWLHSGNYTEIVQSFQHKPRLTVAIVDPRQDFVPIMDSELNFIAAEKEDFWYLYLCLGDAGKSPFIWPDLIDSKSIADVSACIEAQLALGKTELELVALLADNSDFHTAPYDFIPAPIQQNHPQYDGFFRVGEVYWLGIYNVGQRMSLLKLEHLLNVCQSQNINYIDLSTWGSLLIKDLKRTAVDEWNRYLGLNNLNIGPAYHELNWKLDPFNLEHHALKVKVNEALQKAGLRTWGLSLGVASETRRIRPSILIRVHPKKLFGRQRYDLYHAKHFNPVNGEYVLFDGHMVQQDLISNLKGLISQYQRRMRIKVEPIQALHRSEKNKTIIYECRVCLTQYVPDWGDPEHGIAVGTAFADLPSTYCCPVCESSQAVFAVK